MDCYSVISLDGDVFTRWLKYLGIKLHGEGVEFCKSSFYENVRGRIYMGMKVLATKFPLWKFSREMCRRKIYSESKKWLQFRCGIRYWHFLKRSSNPSWIGSAFEKKYITVTKNWRVTYVLVVVYHFMYMRSQILIRKILTKVCGTAIAALWRTYVLLVLLI